MNPILTVNMLKSVKFLSCNTASTNEFISSLAILSNRKTYFLTKAWQDFVELHAISDACAATDNNENCFKQKRVMSESWGRVRLPHVKNEASTRKKWLPRVRINDNPDLAINKKCVHIFRILGMFLISGMWIGRGRSSSSVLWCSHNLTLTCLCYC